MPGKFRAGKNSRVSITGSNFNLQSWHVTYSAAEHDTTNFENGAAAGGGFATQAVSASRIIGVQELKWDIGTLWDAGASPFANPPQLYMRDDGTNMLLYTNVTDGKYWNMPTWLCNNVDSASTVRGQVTMTASGFAQADFTLANINTSVV